MNEINQRLNRTALSEVLKARGFSQITLAERLGVNEKSFSRWINEGHIQSKYVWDLTEILDLTDGEVEDVLMLPKYKVFFRKKYLGEVPKEVEDQAVELSKTLFGLTYLNSQARFCPPNVSKVESDIEVANQIRKYTKIEAYTSLQGIISSLAEQGVEVALVPFDKLGLSSPGEYEQAFSVTDEKRCLIFLDGASPEERLIFNLCHELAHLFRPDHEFSKSEERFCNEVASELVYPRSFFDAHRLKIESIVQQNSSEAIINLLNVIRENLGGEIFGLSIRLKNLGFLSQKDPLHKRIIGYSSSVFDSLPLVGTKLFASFEPTDKSQFQEFWESEEISNNALLRFFFHVQSAAVCGDISPRKFSELFNVDIGMADEMFHSWRMELQNKLESLKND